jgi:hypothetical protein
MDFQPVPTPRGAASNQGRSCRGAYANGGLSARLDGSNASRSRSGPTLNLVHTMRRAAIALLLLLLVGCSLAKNTTENNLIVDFQNRQAVAARNTVSVMCGKLPGISVVPPRKDDVSVYFDIDRASAAQQNALANCINNLVTSDKALGIRGYRFDDGTDS